MRKSIKKIFALLISIAMILPVFGGISVLAARQGSAELMIQGSIVDLQDAPYSEFDTVFVPLEEVCGYLKIAVEKSGNTYTLKRAHSTIVADVNNLAIRVDDREVKLPAGIAIQGEKAFAPVELFSLGFGCPVTMSNGNRRADIDPNKYVMYVTEEKSAAVFAGNPDVDVISTVTSGIDYLCQNNTHPEADKAIYHMFDLSVFDDKTIKNIQFTATALRVSGTSNSFTVIRTAPWKKGEISYNNRPNAHTNDVVNRGSLNTTYAKISFDVTYLAELAKGDGDEFAIRLDALVSASKADSVSNQIAVQGVNTKDRAYLTITLDEKYEFPVKQAEGAAPATENYDEAALLRSLDVIRQSDEFPLDLGGELISRGEFVKFAMRLRGENTIEGDSNQFFSDVPQDNVYFKDINAARAAGYVSGEKGAQFRPFDIITLSEAAAVIGRVLGYDVYAMQKGGSMQSYLDAATRQGLLKGVQNNGGSLSFAGMIKLLYNSLDAAMFEATVFNQAGAEYAFNEDKTILSEYFDAKIIEGTVLANEYSALPGSTYKEGEINVEGKVLILNHKPYNEYLGYKVKAYFNSEDELLYMGVKDKNIDVINLGKVNGSNKSGSVITISYEDENGKNKTESLSDLTYIYNGKYVAVPTAELFRADGGEVKIVGDRVAVITAYKTVAVYGINTDTEIIYDRYDEYENSIPLKNKQYSFTDEEGKEVLLENIVKNDVISVARSLDGEMIRGIVSKRSVTSAIELIENDGSDDMKVTVNGIEYKIKNKNPKWTGNLSLGKEGTFFIDVFGNIVGFTNEVSSEQPGYLLDVQKISNGLSHKIQAAMMIKAEEEYKVFDFAQKIMIDGEMMKTKQEADDIVNYFSYTYKNENNEDVTGFEKQGVIYTLNASNEICSLDTYKLGASEDIEKNLYRAYTLSEAKLKLKNSSLKGKFYLKAADKLNVVQTVASDPTLDDFMSVKSGISDDDYNFEAYTMGNKTPLMEIFFYKGSVSTSVPTLARLSVVDKVVTTYDEDGYEIKKMYYYDGDKRSSVIVPDDKLSLVTNVKRGDVVRFGTDTLGELSALTEYYDYETYSLSQTALNNLGSGFADSARTHGGYTETVTEPYIKVSAVPGDPDTTSYTWVDSGRIIASFYKYEADSSGIEVTKATLADLRPYDKVPFDPTGIILHSGYENMRKNAYIVRLTQPANTGFNKVTYSADAEGVAGTDDLPGMTRVNIGDSFTLPAFPSYLSREDYKIDEENPWMVYGTAYGAGESFVIEGDTVVTPNWVYAPTARITLTAGDGTGAPVTEFCPEQSAYTVRAIAGFTKYGHVISGWKDESGTFYRNGESVPVGTNDMTLTAQWFKAWTGEAATSLTTDADGYYLISSGEELAAFGALTEEDPSVNGRLTENIYMNYYGTEGDYKWYESENLEKANNFFPYRIGKNSSAPYRGTFDGNGKTIYNLYAEGADYTAFFGSTNGATVKNLTFKNAYIISANTANKGMFTAVISAYATSTTFENVDASGYMAPKSSSHYMNCAGAIAGVMTGPGSVAKNCDIAVDMNLNFYTALAGTTSDYHTTGIGGFVGSARGGSSDVPATSLIENCTYSGTIDAPYCVYTGGILGNIYQRHVFTIKKTTLTGSLAGYQAGPNRKANPDQKILGAASSGQNHGRVELGTGENANDSSGFTVTFTVNN